MMRFHELIIEICFLIMLVSGICLPDDEAFISMNGDCGYPAVAMAGRNIYLTWLFTEIRPRAVYFRRSTDEGRSWSDARRISRENSDCLPPSIAIDSGILHLAWIDCGEVIDGEMHYTRSLDGGDTWGKGRIIVGNANSAMCPLFACEGSNVYLLWEDVETGFFSRPAVTGGEHGKMKCFWGKWASTPVIASLRPFQRKEMI